MHVNAVGLSTAEIQAYKDIFIEHVFVSVCVYTSEQQMKEKQKKSRRREQGIQIFIFVPLREPQRICLHVKIQMASLSFRGENVLPEPSD